MTEDNETIEKQYQLFIEKVAASKLVWGLHSKKGWANSHSAENEEVDVVPFWSDRAAAKLCAKDDWSGYLPADIPLAEFLETWCIEMAENEILIGINWDANLAGIESSALGLAFDILTQLNSMQSAIKFTNYGSIDEFLADINEQPE